MIVRHRVKESYLARIDDLIERGQGLPKVSRQRSVSNSYLTGEHRTQTEHLMSYPEFVEWRTSCAAVLDQVVPRTSILREKVAGIGALHNQPTAAQFLIAFLRGVKTEIEAGSLDSLTMQLEAEVLADYMGQATSTLAGTAQLGYVAAAVILGASLERGLRTMCERLEPSEPTHNDRGAPLALNALADTLKRRHAVSALDDRQLRLWIEIRNHAAHGHFDKLTRPVVEDMAKGVERFLADHMR